MDMALVREKNGKLIGWRWNLGAVLHGLYHGVANHAAGNINNISIWDISSLCIDCWFSFSIFNFQLAYILYLYFPAPFNPTTLQCK